VWDTGFFFGAGSVKTRTGHSGGIVADRGTRVGDCPWKDEPRETEEKVFFVCFQRRRSWDGFLPLLPGVCMITGISFYPPIFG